MIGRGRHLGCGVILAVLAATSAGCFRVGTLPPIEYYALSIPDIPLADGTRRGVEPVLSGTLAIAPVETPGIYGDGGIVFRLGETQLHTYPTREWATPLSDMLGMATESVLGSRPLTPQPALFDPPSRHTYTYVWRSRVREFEEVNRGTEVLAAVGIDARLVVAATDSVVWSGSARRERTVETPTMPAIVRTLSQLAAEVILHLADSARITFEPATAATARPPR